MTDVPVANGDKPIPPVPLPPIDDPVLGASPLLYRPGLWRSAKQIEVAEFRQILIWPLALAPHAGSRRSAGHGDADPGAAIDVVARELEASGRWSRVDDLLDHAGMPHVAGTPWGADYQRDEDAAQTYGEFVFFYDFLQGLLYARNDGSTTRRGLNLFRNEDIGGVDFEIDGKTYRALIERFNIYLFRTGAAAVVLELNYNPDPESPLLQTLPADGPRGRPLTLADAQTVTDLFRRVYTPYFFRDVFGNDTAHRPAGVPSAVTWLDASGRPISFEVSGPPDDGRGEGERSPAERRSRFEPKAMAEDLAFIRGVRNVRAAPIAEHWRVVLSPLRFVGYDEAAGKPIWRHIVDERIPLMTWISLTGAASRLGIGPAMSENYVEAQRCDMRIVSRGDWIRLCYADKAGNDELPYAPNFLANFEHDACYDRFWPSDVTDGASRIMFAGYHFAMVGSGAGFFDRITLHHFRRHYFQMALIANMELASLLSTSSRISSAVERLNTGRETDSRAEFRAELRGIQSDFLDFVHRFRFTGVSNQIQPSELFDRLRKSLRLDALYRDVKDELAAAVSVNQSEEQAEISRSAHRLTAVATVAAGFGIAFAFMSISMVTDPVKALNPLRPTSKGDGGDAAAAVADLVWGGLVVLVVLVLAVLGTRVILTGIRASSGIIFDEETKVDRFVRDTLGTIVVAAVALVGLMAFCSLAKTFWSPIVMP